MSVAVTVMSVLCLLCLWPGAPARADSTLTEAEVIRRARVHAPGARVAAATEALAGAEQRGAGLLPDPAVEWDRETGPSGAQDTVRAIVPIDMARPMTRRALARSHSEWLRAQAALDRAAAIERALVAFYDVALAAERVLSVASLIGFITLFGIATRNGILLATRTRDLELAGCSRHDAVVQSARERLAPIVMTAVTAGLGLLPLALAVGQPGSEIQAPMALVILTGLVTSTALNMIVVPALLHRWGGDTARGSHPDGRSSGESVA
jgi:hypothetical protein